MDSQNTLEIGGKIHKHSPAELFAEISQTKFSGSLRLSKEKQKVIAYFENGEVVFAVSNSRRHRLFEILLGENAVPKEKLVKIEGFIHDLHLAKKLVEEELLTKQIIDSVFSIQIKQILKTVWSWNGGEWSFSPLAKIKEGIKFEVDLKSRLTSFSRSLKNEDIIKRFKSFTESFSLNSRVLNLNSLNPTPNEAFILSRLSENELTIDEIRSMCGLPKEELFGALYRLWLGGVIKRGNWNSFFTAEDVAKIAEAKLVLKKSATSFEEERAREEEAKREQDASENQKHAKVEEANKPEKGLSVDDYLNRVKAAATHYEIFAIAPDANLAELKKVYFSYAKNFHPDLFHKMVDDEKHLQIQHAFTEIARAYDALKNSDSRELYDFKLRKVIEAAKKNVKSKTSVAEDFKSHKNSGEAAAQFERGHDLFLDGNVSQALPFLERASKLNQENAKYHAFLGKSLSRNKSQRHRAESELQTAIKLDKESSEYRMMLAEFYVEMGLVARAKGELTKLLKMAPNNDDARSLLDRISDK